jgi:beta-N-acetylhexosaminidase
MVLGPLMVDLAGPQATSDELARLRDPRVGGLILFTRNFLSVEQLQSLVGEVRASRPDILVAVDHEGGRVQRFRDGFTRLPSMRRIGELYDRAPAEGIAAARDIAFLLASELRLCGVDLSFTPVLDLDWGRSGVIGDRSFHRDPEVVATLGQALVEGLHAAGMAACGKHFPGHGWAEADSHLAVPVDERGLDRLQADLSPFRKVAIDAVMPAHVIYPAMDDRPAGFSPLWHRYLREEVGFKGVVFSDDLSMEGASVAGGVLQRIEAAWNAGCDMLLLCNAPDKVADVLDHWNPVPDPVRAGRLQIVRRRPPACTDRHQLIADARWQRGHQHCQVLTA